MDLVIGDRTVTPTRCRECGRSYDFVKGFVWKAGEPWAVYFAAFHGHPDHEAAIDVILGTWGDDSDDDHLTFSTRVRAEGAQSVDAPIATLGESAIFGRFLRRDEALSHDRVADFWAVVDAVVEQDPSCPLQGLLTRKIGRGRRPRGFRMLQLEVFDEISDEQDARYSARSFVRWVRLETAPRRPDGRVGTAEDHAEAA